jgi:hypothetical protein
MRHPVGAGSGGKDVCASTTGEEEVEVEGLISQIIGAILSGISFVGVCAQPALEYGPVSVAVPIKAGVINAPQCELGGR